MDGSIEESLFEAEEKMDKAVEVAKEDFSAIRTGRANAAMFNKLTVDYYGAPTPLQQLATFQTPEARTILVQPFDKGSMAAIEKALRESDPAAAHEWRLRLRAQMEGLLGSGLRIAGYDTARGYLFTA